MGEEYPVFSQPLSEAGYKLIHLGKWHIVGPNPNAETRLPFKKKLAQPNNGDLSWVPLMQGQPLTERALFWHVASTYKDPPCSIIRKGKWKLIQYLKKGTIELYDTDADLKESHNLSKSNPEMAQNLLNELVAWRQQNDVPLPPSSSLTK